MKRPNPVHPILAIGILLPLALAACGEGSREDVRAPYHSFGPSTVATMVARLPGGETPSGTIRIVGETVINGRTFQAYKVAMDPVHPQNGIELWIDKEDDDRFTFQGYEEPGVMSVVADRPHTIRTDGPEGVPQTVEFGATTTTFESGESRTGTAVVEYVKESDDVTLQTAFGTLSGVKHFSGTVTLQGEAAPALIEGVPLDVELWYHPSFGIVKGDMPLLNLGLDMKTTEDCGDPMAPGFNSIQKVGLVRPGGERFRLATYDCSGDFNADKNTHAKMLLELRFADEDQARSGTQPPVIETFGTVWGTFPERLVASPFSIFHPEENGQGYTFWYALVDEAAKNEPGSNGIAYRIEVEPADTMTHAVRATARIRYNVIQTP